MTLLNPLLYVNVVTNSSYMYKYYRQKRKRKNALLEDKINKLWFAPNMPGFIEAQIDFQNNLDKLQPKINI